MAVRGSNEPPQDDSYERNEWAGDEATQLYRVGASQQVDPRSGDTQDDTRDTRRPSSQPHRESAVQSPPRPQQPPPSRLRAPPASAMKTDRGDQSTETDPYRVEQQQFGSAYELTQWCNTAFDEDSDTTSTHVVKAKEKKKRKERPGGGKGKRRRSLINIVVDRALRRSKGKHAAAQSPSAVDKENSQGDMDEALEPAEPRWQWQCKWPVCCAVLRSVHALLCAAAAGTLFATAAGAYGALAAAANAAVVCVADLVVMSTHACARCRRRADVAISMRRMSMALDAMAAVLLVTALALCVNMLFIDADNAPKHDSRPVQFYLAVTALAACAVSAPISVVHFFCG